MSDDGRSEYRSDLAERLRKLREAKHWTQGDMALALGIPEERYRKYESRSFLPIYLVERLSVVTGRSIHFIVTGKEQRAAPAIRLPRVAKRAQT